MGIYYEGELMYGMMLYNGTIYNQKSDIFILNLRDKIREQNLTPKICNEEHEVSYALDEINNAIATIDSNLCVDVDSINIMETWFCHVFFNI